MTVGINRDTTAAIRPPRSHLRPGAGLEAPRRRSPEPGEDTVGLGFRRAGGSGIKRPAGRDAPRRRRPTDGAAGPAERAPRARSAPARRAAGIAATADRPAGRAVAEL